MKYNPPPKGHVLMVTLGLLTVVCTFAGIAFNITSTNAQNVGRSGEYARAQAAAEGALEYAYAIWSRRIGRGQFATESFSGLTPPEFPGVEYADSGALTVSALDAYGVAKANGVPIVGRVPGYQGWSGRTRNYAAIARVKLPHGGEIGVRRIFQYTEVPLFQSMFFFQSNLELYRPATMIINGLMHTNSRMYIRIMPDSLTVQGNVTYTEGYHEEESPYAKFWTAGYDKNLKHNPINWAIGKDAQLNQVPPIQPMGGKPEEVFNTGDTNPNNDGYRELIEPPVGGHIDPPAISARRLINKAGLVVEINSSLAEANRIKVNGANGAYASAAVVAKVKEAIKIEQGHAAYSYYEGNKRINVAASGIYDAREATGPNGGWVDVSTVDIGVLNTALKDITAFNNVVYIHDVTPRVSGNAEPKTIRLTNGRVLPDSGLTIASQNPVYVQGDYNTGRNGNNGPPASVSGNPNNSPSAATVSGYSRKPAAIISDAVMLLSNAWQDVNTHSGESGNLNQRMASHTTYNMAILAGFQRSSNGNYSGGANNFPRFLENWTNKYCTYFGSMVELFESEVFKGKWDTGKIYNPPNRCWNFDTNFLTVPPPGSVEAVVLNRGPWSRL